MSQLESITSTKKILIKSKFVSQKTRDKQLAQKFGHFFVGNIEGWQEKEEEKKRNKTEEEEGDGTW